MGTLFIFLIIAVVVWAIVSMVMLYLQESKQEKEPQSKVSNAGKKAEDPISRGREKGVPDMQAASSADTKFGQMAGGADVDWKQQLKQMPGVLGWLLIDTEGELLQASDFSFVAAAESDPTIRKIVTLISQLKPEVGDNSLRLMEWEGPQGQVLVAFPEDPFTPERLVLFLDTETFKNQMRDLLAKLKWESHSEKELVR